MNRFVAIKDFGESAITSASGSAGVPGRFLFLFAAFELGLGLELLGLGFGRFGLGS